jgi:hypothetical protein
VGQLIYHCAAALPSDFEATGTVSGAEHPYVLWTYFGYRSNGITEYDFDYSSSDWYNMIAADIDANRPISYGLFGELSGHALVCDGYRNGNEIHLDLGWSGAGTAWYNIDSVNFGRYTWTEHSAVFGITPSSIHPPTIIYVNSSATGANNGSSWADAYTSLQSALSEALSGDEIWVAKGTYKPTTDTDREISFETKECISIYGGFAGTEISRDQRNWVANPTILSGDIGVQGDNSDNSYNVLYGYMLGSTLDGFTITGGNASGKYYNSGGGMKTGGWGTISNCIFIDNLATYGGGLAFSDSIVINCVFIGNSAAYGGGIYNDSSGWISNCTFSGNRAEYGGGMYGNYCYWDYLAVTNCIFWNNTAEYGEEIAEVNSSIIDISYCDIKGGLLAIYDDGTGTINWGPGNIDSDPCFVSPGYWDVNRTPDDTEDDFWVDGDYHLLPDSPCINAGDPNYVPEPNETDLDGKPRVIGGRIDMGAYEFNHRPVAITGINQLIYAWIDGLADVNLDGLASYDEDNQPLSCKWSWTINGNTFNTDCVKQAIELPVGQHTISLIVNDGIEDSEPNEVVITVVGPVEANLCVMPKVLNSKIFMRAIMTTLRLPKGINKDQIDSNEPILLYPGQIEADWMWICRELDYKCRAWNTTIFASFDKDELIDEIDSNGAVELAVVGQLKSGQYFYGTDKVFVICPGNWPRHKPWCNYWWNRWCHR